MSVIMSVAGSPKNTATFLTLTSVKFTDACRSTCIANQLHVHLPIHTTIPIYQLTCGPGSCAAVGIAIYLLRIVFTCSTTLCSNESRQLVIAISVRVYSIMLSYAYHLLGLHIYTQVWAFIMILGDSTTKRYFIL